MLALSSSHFDPTAKFGRALSLSAYRGNAEATGHWRAPLRISGLHMTRPVPTIQPAATTAEQHIELVKSAFDKWERRVEGSPTWDDVDELMGAIFNAINSSESSHG